MWCIVGRNSPLKTTASTPPASTRCRISSGFPRPTKVRLSGWSRRWTIVSATRCPAEARRAVISSTAGVRETRRTSNGSPNARRPKRVSSGNHGVGGHTGPYRRWVLLTLSKVNPFPGRADRLWPDDEGDPRSALPVLLALRGPGRPAGPGVPIPRLRPIRSGPAAARGGPRRVPRASGRGAPAPTGGDSGAAPAAVRQRLIRAASIGTEAMRVRVRLFATYREITGEGAVPWTLPDGARLRELLDALVGTYPRLAMHADTMLLAVNLNYASPDVVLHDGDEVAVMPPVSGGRT